MIKSFRHKALKRLFEHGDPRGLPADMIDRLNWILNALNSAKRFDDLARPSFRLHALKGDLKGHWAATVRANWRIVSRYDHPDVHDINFIDYH